MNILFIGTKKSHDKYLSNSYLQYSALKKLYKNIDSIDTSKILFLPSITRKIFIHISPFIFEHFINYQILTRTKKKYDLIWVKGGDFIGKKLILELKKITKKIVFICNDNPFVKRDKQRWRLFLSAAKYYDCIIFQDPSRIIPSKKLGVKKSMIVLPPYDQKTHKKHNISIAEKKRYQNDIIFIGTWSPKKGEFIKKIIELGININVYGLRWDKDPNYESLKSKIKLKHIHNPKYSKLIQSSKIALCLFAEENLDTITARSIEIPAIGTLLCSKRTKAMKNIFIEDKEAIFFSTPKECAKKINYYLKNQNKAKDIARRGHIKITKILNPSHENLIQKVINNIY
ncbi:glycosyltransferase [Candidatus Pelagibacter sp.]|nr:glycosyltransferase [Candidatus Pelagibacter sp.]